MLNTMNQAISDGLATNLEHNLTVHTVNLS
jgi:hypothetical protein